MEKGQVLIAESKSAVRLWKAGTSRGVAYVEGKERAERIIEAAGRGSATAAVPTRNTDRNTEKILPGSMAVYCDSRGRPFAWQISFDIRHWGSVLEVAEAIQL